jgi:hypothetical protein
MPRIRHLERPTETFAARGCNVVGGRTASDCVVRSVSIYVWACVCVCVYAVANANRLPGVAQVLNIIRVRNRLLLLLLLQLLLQRPLDVFRPAAELRPDRLQSSLKSGGRRCPD